MFNPPVFLGIGITGLCIGLVLMFGAPQTSEEATQLAQLPLVSATQLADTAAGTEVLLEGRVALDSSTHEQPFIAYVREIYASDLLNDTERWQEIDRQTPAFGIELADGLVPVANTGYDFPLIRDTFQESAPTTTQGAVRLRGLRPGAPILARGTVAADGLQATTIYPGPRDALLADMQGWARGEFWIGAAIALVGALLTGLGGWQLRTFLQQEQAAQAAQVAPEAGQPRRSKRRR